MLDEAVSQSPFSLLRLLRARPRSEFVFGNERTLSFAHLWWGRKRFSLLASTA